MAKSRDAFRTISEVSDWLGTPAHVLRFWESRFTQIKPIKRAGGRRYYRPADMFLLGGIRRLLHDDGLTIKGVQKILREKGVKYVAALSIQTLNGDESKQADDTPEPRPTEQTPVEEILGDPVPQALEDQQNDVPVPGFGDKTTGTATRTPDEPDEIAALDAPISPEVLAVNEIDDTARQQRIAELYNRLRSLRNRIRASMG